MGPCSWSEPVQRSADRMLLLTAPQQQSGPAHGPQGGGRSTTGENFYTSDELGVEVDNREHA
ncbi:hypothetical protein ACFVWY_32860 [Streptomyces sp. NPDC058195]|uniref:hypothetical protein n=1 Tax=Streptomyces sp. NPDC058195 TaxID=3346375 RepID=UPI0036ECC16B